MSLIILVSVVAAVAWHISLRRFWPACAASVLTSIVCVWLLAMNHFGWFDATFLENLILVTLVSFIITVALGFLLSRLKKST